MNELTQRGIVAVKAGDRIAARKLLSAALRLNPADLQAWLWLSGAVERDEERLDCLRQIQRLEPNNEVATRGIAQILAKNPHLRPRADQPLVKIEKTAQKPFSSISDTAVGNPARSEGDLLAEDASLLERAAQIPQRPPVKKTDDKVRSIPIIFPRQAPISYKSPQRIFRSRPSLVPSILYFWLMIFLLYGTLAITAQSEIFSFIFPTILGLAVVCGGITLYSLVRLYNTRYELTSEVLAFPHTRQMLELPVWTILTLESQQNLFQRALGMGDILMDVPLEGLLARVRIRNIPNVTQRANQILQLVREVNL